MTPRFPSHSLAAFLLLVVLAHANAWSADRASRFDSYFSPGNSAEVSASLEPGTDGAPAIRSESAGASVLVSSNGARSWSVNGRAARMTLSRAVVIPGTGLAFPDKLWDAQAGVSHRHRLGEGRQWGVNAAVGSASDDPFHSIRETEIQATGSYIKPSGPHDSWLFLLSYSNNRTFANGVPLPGFAYVRRVPSKGFQAIVGFPFLLVRYAPAETWAARASLFGTNNQALDVSRRLAGPVRAYVAFEHGAKTWFRAARGKRKERLIYDQKRAVVGVRGPLPGGLSLDAAAGRVFGRRLYEAEDVRSSGVSRARLPDGWLLSLDLSGRWGG